MKDWQEKLDSFLQFNQRAILEHSGKMSMEEAKRLAIEVFFNETAFVSQQRKVQ